MLTELCDIGALIVTPGTTYRVEKVLGHGGMGTVYEAVDKNLNSLVVLKVLHPRLARTSVRERFEREARAIAQITHPNIVRVTRLGCLEDPDRTPFYVMDRLVGQSLRAVLHQRTGGLRIDQALNIAVQVLSGLEAVHDRGLVHRDIKPENIVLHVDAQGENSVKIIDFGVMRVLADRGREGFAGTFAYAAPEQLRLESVDPRADVFAVGMVLFETLTGRHPYEAFGVDEAGAIVRARLGAPSLASYGEFPPALVRLVAQALALAPDARPAGAFEFAAELRKISRALAPVDLHAAITAPLAEEEPVAATAVRAITLADLAAPTDPDGDLPERMWHLRIERKRAAILGLAMTEPGASGGASGNAADGGTLRTEPGLADNDTVREPPPVFSRLGHVFGARASGGASGTEPLAAPARPRPDVRLPAPSVSAATRRLFLPRREIGIATPLPSQELPPPDPGRNVVYVDATAAMPTHVHVVPARPRTSFAGSRSGASPAAPLVPAPAQRADPRSLEAAQPSVIVSDSVAKMSASGIRAARPRATPAVLQKVRLESLDREGASFARNRWFFAVIALGTLLVSFFLVWLLRTRHDAGPVGLGSTNEPASPTPVKP